MNYTYGDAASQDNGGRPYTNFKTIAGSMVDEDRFDIYRHHNPSWGVISDNSIDNPEHYDFACAEVWASPSNAATSVDLWFSERGYVDDAVKSLKYNKNTMTYSQLEKALDNAENRGVIGHYTFCLFADHRDVLGFASSSAGSLGHRAWGDDEDTARYTFKEMDDYVTEYLEEIGY